MQNARVMALVADPDEAITKALDSTKQRMVVEARILDSDHRLDCGQLLEELQKISPVYLKRLVTYLETLRLLEQLPTKSR